MKRITVSRRRLLANAGQIATGTVLAGISGCAKQPAAVCASPDLLSDPEKALRASLQYTDQSPDPANACGGCAYFRAGAETGGCGNCQILSGPVDARGHCTSWSAKA